MSALGPLPLPHDKWDQLARELELCPQHKRVVELILRCCADKEIVAAMGISKPTLRTYINRIFGRLRVSDRVELVALICALSHGIGITTERNDVIIDDVITTSASGHAVNH
jgi:DNA-binding NarL/FixJ family response regulator